MFVTDEGSAGLVASRLAIRDLTSAGHMPMMNENRQVVLSYNGEIYNADDLRAILQDLGYRFRSTSDSEVILRGYEAWGREVVRRLQGMFAFALLDLRDGEAKLLLARDRLGIKPLYYSVGSHGLVFASELRALLRSDMVDANVSSTAVAMYLLLGSVPKPFTIFEGVVSLPPASTLEFVAGKVELRTYWRFPEPDGQLARGDAEAQVRELLTDSVRRHLVSDVPLGVFLSGGLDSGIITALMRSAGVDALRTCSISFPATRYDESPVARVVAEATGSEHFEEAITAGDVKEEMASIVAAMGQPTVDGVNTYFVSRTAKRAGLTVAMSGLGGDELFGGYGTFDRLPTLLKRLRIASFPGGSIAGTLAARFSEARIRPKLLDAFSRKPSAASAYLAYRGLFSPTEVGELLGLDRLAEVLSSTDVLGLIDAAAQTDESTPTDLQAWISRAELGMYMGNQLLSDTDVMSMRHSLEVRVPFLDDRLVEGVLSMPSSVKTGPGVKPLLVGAVGHLLPDELRRPSTKRGFTFPFETWLNGELRGSTSTALDPSIVRRVGWLDPSAVAGVLEGFRRGQVHWSRVWSLFILQRWLDSVAGSPSLS
jgi:asparagine synthase (glutamine-hydrolysing)